MLLFPKPTKQKKAKKRLRRTGVKTDAWEITRKVLVARFAAVGITQCELGYDGCWKNNTLTFAHSKKRRYIESDEELREVCLCCQSCHARIEFNPDMYEIVRRVIAGRKVAV